MSKEIRIYFGFVLLRSVIGLKNPRHTLDQTDTKVNSVANVSPAFTRALGHLLLFNVSFLWPQNFVLFRVVPMKFVLRSVIVTKTCATISANQMQNKTIANLSHAFSRALLSPFDLLYIQL